MATKLFVGGLSYSLTETQLRSLFEEIGEVASAQLIIDRATEQSKGFGFVEMTSDAEAQQAIKALNGKEIGGRSIIVNVARPREDRPDRPFGNHQNNMGNNFRRSRR